MKIHVYTVSHNESFMMPYFLRHYSSFADKIFVFDDNSDDGTQDIVRACPTAHLMLYPYPSGLNEDDLLATYGSYKFSRGLADWVICVDVDELVYHPSISVVLSSTRQSLITPRGFCMVSGHLPTTEKQIYTEVRWGAFSRTYSKPVVFRPELDIEWKHGRHGLVRPALPRRDDGLKLLHFYYLSPQYHLDRKRRNLSRMNPDPFSVPSERPELENQGDYRLRRARDSYRKLLQSAVEVV